jgi:cell division protein FtsX
MALFIRQNEDRSKLQERLAAELQERSKQKANRTDMVDGVMDSEYIKDTKQTTSLAWLWILIVLAGMAALVWLVVLNTLKS